ncbi:uncharacterized protein LOC119588900 [Penaeus monodon]|uniref:uncharacterized protein LOC119588900 n=1 Tax=Penaeus monodon TaxID=6687 RepID=UPI0018A708A8|nr:uncharacterized protein LOC119588900 [Penaeus monodon]
MPTVATVKEVQVDAVTSPALTNLLAPAKDGHEIFPSLDHLNENEKTNIQNLFQKFPSLFSIDTMDIAVFFRPWMPALPIGLFQLNLQIGQRQPSVMELVSGNSKGCHMCEIAVRKFKFLGFEVSAEGILPDPEKVHAITEMTYPKDVRGIRRFLGAAGFFRRHIAKFF